MKLNKDRLWKLLDSIAETLPDKRTAGYRELARRLGVHVPQLHRILNTDSEAGAVFLGRLKEYCEANGLDFNEFLL